MKCLIVLSDHKTISEIHNITYPTITSVISNLKHAKKFLSRDNKLKEVSPLTLLYSSS